MFFGIFNVLRNIMFLNLLRLHTQNGKHKDKLCCCFIYCPPFQYSLCIFVGSEKFLFNGILMNITYFWMIVMIRHILETELSFWWLPIPKYILWYYFILIRHLKREIFWSLVIRWNCYVGPTLFQHPPNIGTTLAQRKVSWPNVGSLRIKNTPTLGQRWANTLAQRRPTLHLPRWANGGIPRWANRNGQRWAIVGPTYNTKFQNPTNNSFWENCYENLSLTLWEEKLIKPSNRK